MLDSGASCNFMSLDLCRQLGLNLKTKVEYNVRLADGGVLKTCGQVVLHVDFGAVKYHGVFHVLPGAIPLILGMSFLGEVSPQVNWKRKLVFKNNKRFTVAKLAKPRAAAHVEGAPTPVHNSFGALADCALDDDNCVEATLDDDDDDDVCIVSDKPRAAGDIDLGCRPPAAERSTCVSCGKFVDAGMTKCERCVNNSFAGTAA